MGDRELEAGSWVLGAGSSEWGATARCEEQGALKFDHSGSRKIAL